MPIFSRKVVKSNSNNNKKRYLIDKTIPIVAETESDETMSSSNTCTTNTMSSSRIAKMSIKSKENRRSSSDDLDRLSISSDESKEVLPITYASPKKSPNRVTNGFSNSSTNLSNYSIDNRDFYRNSHDSSPESKSNRTPDYARTPSSLTKRPPSSDIFQLLADDNNKNSNSGSPLFDLRDENSPVFGQSNTHLEPTSVRKFGSLLGTSSSDRVMENSLFQLTEKQLPTFYSNRFTQSITTEKPKILGRNNSNNKMRFPLPDQSAFDDTISADSSGGGLVSAGKASPCLKTPCPPTPQSSSKKSGMGMYPGSFRIERQSSLDDVKLLLEDSNRGFRHIFSDNMMNFVESSGSSRKCSSLLHGDTELSFSDTIKTIDSTSSAKISMNDCFEIAGLIDSGSFADVYKVREKSDGSTSSSGVEQWYALKKSKRQFRSKSDRQWLLNEVHFLKLLLRSPCKYVTRFVRAWQEDHYIHMQLELAERGSLKDLVSKLIKDGRTVSDSTIWHIVHDVSAGLKHIHSCGLVHLDIKPANLLISRDGDVIITDFGMASRIGSSDDSKEGDNR